jgi:hypothetical protein
MTPEEAVEIARELYGDHPAAVALVMEALHGSTDERRRRSWRALLALDPAEPLPNAADELGRMVGVVLVEAIGRSTNASRRLRCARLLQLLCREARDVETEIEARERECA